MRYYFCGSYLRCSYIAHRSFEEAVNAENTNHHKTNMEAINNVNKKNANGGNFLNASFNEKIQIKKI